MSGKSVEGGKTLRLLAILRVPASLRLRLRRPWKAVVQEHGQGYAGGASLRCATPYADSVWRRLVVGPERHRGHSLQRLRNEVEPRAKRVCPCHPCHLAYDVAAFASSFGAVASASGFAARAVI